MTCSKALSGLSPGEMMRAGAPERFAGLRQDQATKSEHLCPRPLGLSRPRRCWLGALRDPVTLLWERKPHTEPRAAASPWSGNG